ncbi:hypothetical protein [Sporosarcina cyprini]|uniref:hypothetical protein n=1 Tax=Sporosarcina cyprini TaxID=2910523 RepID=UPI001EE140B3|nr:hypothetical protein [Sporosarcina cyprini]MCG3087562.1 hypothetical protein [Sporosarcina cyprini]
MAKDKNNKKNDSMHDSAQPKMSGVEFTDEQRQTNEVASTSYTGSRKDKTNLKDDKLETGGY